MNSEHNHFLPFNSPLETGLRSLGVLVSAGSRRYDLQQLINLDYLVVHTGDVGGPISLHPQMPLRSTELLVRRNLVERGALLMVSRDLIERTTDDRGIMYSAGDFSEVFFDSLTSSYLIDLRSRAEWVIDNFGDFNSIDLQKKMSNLFDRWVGEFQAIEKLTSDGNEI